MKKFFITGATGFVGSYLVHSLVEKGESVTILARDNKLNWRLKDIKKDIAIIQSNLLDVNLEKKVKEINPDFVFHLAAYGSLPQESDINQMIDINVKGTINLIDSIKKTECQLFINTGSSSEYGIVSTAMKETDATSPINDYGITKLAGTLYCKKEAERNNLPIITFRLFSPYGPFEYQTRLVPTIVLQALENRQISLANPKHVRDFIYIEDVINAYIKATQVKHLPGEIYNIGSGKQHSVEQIVKEVVRQTKSGSNISWGKIKNQQRQLEPKKWEANINKAKTMLQWEPSYSLKKGIAQTIQWFEENKSLYE